MLAKKWAEWVMNHRISSILLVVISALILGAGGKDAEFSANQRDFFKADDANLAKLIKIEDAYNSDKNVMVLVEPSNNNVFSPDALNAIKQLTEFGWEVPYSQRVESLSNHLYTQVEEDDLYVEYLVENVEELTPQELKKRRQYAINKAGVKDYLITESGDISLVNIILNIPAENGGEAAMEVVRIVREYVENINQQYPDIHFRVVGGVPVEVSLPEIVQEDGRTIFPFALILVFAFLMLVLRDVVGNIVCITTCAERLGRSGARW